MLTYACGTVTNSFHDETGITAYTLKSMYHTWTKAIRDRVFHAKQVADFERKECYFDIKIGTIAFYKAANPLLGGTGEMACVCTVQSKNNACTRSGARSSCAARMCKWSKEVKLGFIRKKFHTQEVQNPICKYIVAARSYSTVMAHMPAGVCLASISAYIHV